MCAEPLRLSDPSSSLAQERVLAAVSRDVLTGLAHLHDELCIVHRDIKPANMLLNLKGETFISDFGMSGQLASSVNKFHSWVGTARLSVTLCHSPPATFGSFLNWRNRR